MGVLRGATAPRYGVRGTAPVTNIQCTCLIELAASCFAHADNCAQFRCDCRVGTYVKVDTVSKIKVIVTGGGGGGGSHNSDDAQGGGGAGGTCVKTIDLSEVAAGTKFAIAVGAGGVGCTGNNNRCGQVGKQSRFASHCIANGKSCCP